MNIKEKEIAMWEAAKARDAKAFLDAEAMLQHGFKN